MTVKVEGKPILGVIDVTYGISCGQWDSKTGTITGEVTYSPLVLTREMQSDSFAFFRRGTHSDERFKVEVTLRRKNPEKDLEEEYVWITLENAVVLEYTIQHQDWKDSSVGGYNPLEIITLGYKKLTLKTADGQAAVEFKKK
jgi:type VI protein secretion system component Hcp